MIAGGVIFMFGAIVVPVLIILTAILGKSNAVQFKVPGTCETSVGKPGRYYLWNDFQTVFNGKSYHRSKTLPDGMEFKIHTADGALLPFVSDTSITSSVNGSSKDSIGYVEIQSPGRVKIEVTGGEEERIFSFAPSDLFNILGLLAGGVGLSALVALSGLGLGLWGIIKFVNSRQKVPGQT